MYQNRIELYKQLEEQFSSKALVYITSDRPNMGAQIASDVIDFFIQHLDRIGPCDKISLFLYTRGGETAAAWNIINLLRMYCDNLQVIIPHKAHSAGTIISLGANEIVMTKQATLGPIDPSINTALNPVTPGGGTFPVSVEAVKGYLEFAKEELAIKDDIALSNIFMKLTESVHPLVLGQVYRSRAQIQMLAEKLLVNQVTDPQKIKNIISFLCSDSGSHDYTINRREAKDDLALKIEKPNTDQYKLIKRIYDDISDELLFNQAFNIGTINGAYSVRRCLLESIEGGSDYFVTEGQVLHITGPNGEELIQNRVLFEGWRHHQELDRFGEADAAMEGEVGYERSKVFQT
mgnify:CR=1 FL=1